MSPAPGFQTTGPAALHAPLAILAGGLGTRLGQATASLPKVLVPVAGRPFLDHQLHLARQRGVTRVVLCIGHMGHLVKEYAGDGRAWGLQVQYSHDGSELRGTAGALRQALHLLGDMFLVLYGDSYLEIDYAAPLRQLEVSSALGLMTVYRNQNQWDRSNVEVCQGRVVRYDKGSGGEGFDSIDYGLGVLRAAALRGGEEADLAGVYARLAGQGQLLAHEVKQRFYEIGSPAGREETARHIRGEVGGRVKG